MRARPAVAGFVAAAIAVSVAIAGPAAVDYASRMADGELMSASQADRMNVKAETALQDLRATAEHIGGLSDVGAAKAIREKAQLVSNELHSVHARDHVDGLDGYADRLQSKGIVLQDAIWMIRKWEFDIRNGNAKDAEEARATTIGILDRLRGSARVVDGVEGYEQVASFSAKP
jgi:hypothetical protein